MLPSQYPQTAQHFRAGRFTADKTKRLLSSTEQNQTPFIIHQIKPNAFYHPLLEQMNAYIKGVGWIEIFGYPAQPEVISAAAAAQ